MVVSDAELRQFGECARGRGLTVSEWVRQALRATERETSLGSGEHKLAAVRSGLSHSFPAPSIDTMNAEIERGYALGSEA